MRRATFLLCLLMSSVADADFHLFSINELYSNADGSVQYVELTALAGGQQFVSGHTIRSTSPAGQVRSFTLPANLPGDTAGRRMLIGTQGFAALGVVTPDYTVPNQFFFQGGGNINWGEGSDIWIHPAAPTDGASALFRNAAPGANTPQNFAGATGSIGGGGMTGPATHQALYWAWPAGTESGWGVNITHQGSTLFATWFTYDTDGSGLWLVLPSAARVVEVEQDPYGYGAMIITTNRYTGRLYRTTGPAFNAVPFNPAAVTVTDVGMATLDFDDPNTPNFSYTANGVSQSKRIVRQVYASPVSVCGAGGTAASPPNHQDLWWASPAGSESGWGVNITHQGNTLFATWFTYGADGRGVWLVMSDGNLTAPDTYTGVLYRTRGPAFSATPWSPSGVTVTPAGTGTFTFSASNQGTFSYTVDGVSQVKPITRQVYASPVSVCRAP